MNKQTAAQETAHLGNAHLRTQRTQRSKEHQEHEDTKILRDKETKRKTLFLKTKQTQKHAAAPLELQRQLLPEEAALLSTLGADDAEICCLWRIDVPYRIQSLLNERQNQLQMQKQELDKTLKDIAKCIAAAAESMSNCCTDETTRIKLDAVKLRVDQEYINEKGNK